jgi:hypothetical protein
MACSPVGSYRRFGDTYCLQFQCQSVNQATSEFKHQADEQRVVKVGQV